MLKYLVMNFAVIKTGGKQYLVQPGDKLEIEKLETEAGKEVVFSDVLLCDKDGEIQVGAPLVKGAKVTAKVIEATKGPKLIIFKYKSKKRYKRKIGHRQHLTKVEITSIT